jgi:hypothetical protein
MALSGAMSGSAPCLLQTGAAFNAGMLSGLERALPDEGEGRYRAGRAR